MSAELNYLLPPTSGDALGGGNASGQTFRTPDSTNVILDRFQFVLSDSSNPLTNWNAYLYEWNSSTGDITGSSLATASGSFQSTTRYVQEIDLPDTALDPLKTYLFYIQGSSNNSNIWSRQPGDYSGGAYARRNNNVWSTSPGSSASFAAYFYSAPTPNAQPISVPAGNFNEQTGIAINLSGTFGGTGIFDIANPEQSGNNDVKTGKYGSLTVSNTGEFSYSANLDKVDSLNTGENPADEFTINLTSPTGAVSSATYRVQIEGYTDPTPSPGPTPAEKSITITGQRGTVSGKPGIIVDGVTTGIEDGNTVIPYFRFPGETSYTQGSARPVVSDGEFSWQRKTGKKTYVYFKNESESVQSNRVIIPAGSAALSSSSLQAFDSDPIVGGSSNQHAGHKKGKRRRPVAPAASFGSRLSEDTNSSLLMATDTSDAGFFKQHDLVAASSWN